MAERDSVNPTHALFDLFVQAQTCRDVRQHFSELCGQLAINPKDFRNFYSKLKERLNYWKAKSLWAKLDKRASHSEYQQRKACVKNKVTADSVCPAVALGRSLRQHNYQEVTSEILLTFAL